MDLLQFVDTLSPTANVRLSLNSRLIRVLANGTDLSPPDANQILITSPIVDGATSAGMVYGVRVLRLKLQFWNEAGTDAIATTVQALARELDRDNLLMWRPQGASQAVWFETFRSPLGVMSDVLAGKVREFDVEIAARPFALGEVVTLAQQTVNNDPAAGSNGMFFDLAGSAIKGDVETPLGLSFVAADVIAPGRRKACIAVRRGGTPANAPFLLQAEACTLGSGSTLQANNAAWSGSGQNSVRSASLTSSYSHRMASPFPFPAVASPDVRGTYRMFHRGAKTVGTDDIRFRIDNAPDGTNVIVGDEAIFPTGTLRRLVNCGLLQMPIGAGPARDWSGVEFPVRGTQLRHHVMRSFGTGSLDSDYTVLFPADDRLCYILWPSATGPASFVLWSDPIEPSVASYGADGAAYQTVPIELHGGTPLVSPGLPARVFYAADVGDTTTAGDDRTVTTRVTPFYRPRYLAVRPPST